MTPHHCDTSDGVRIVCLCRRGQDHPEDLFDVRVGDEGAE